MWWIALVPRPLDCWLPFSRIPPVKIPIATPAPTRELSPPNIFLMPSEFNPLGQPLGPLVPDWRPPPRPAREILTGRDCRLEPLEPARHARDLHTANSLDRDGRNWTYLSYGPFPDFETFHTWVNQWPASHDPLFFAIIDAATNQATGVASYLSIHPNNGSIEVGHLNFSPLLQGTRAATEAMYLMMRHAFALGYRRYEWKCNSHNTPSRRAAQRLGFSYEGRSRHAQVIKGRSRDTAWYSITSEEWTRLQPLLEHWLAPENFAADGKQRTALSTLTAPLLAARG